MCSNDVWTAQQITTRNTSNRGDTFSGDLPFSGDNKPEGSAAKGLVTPNTHISDMCDIAMFQS